MEGAFGIAERQRRQTVTAASPWAQAAAAYPGRPIRLVVPFAAGSSPDVLGHLLAQSLAKSMAATVSEENVPGAGGTLGVDRVAEAATVAQRP